MALWQGKHLMTYGEVIQACIDCTTREEAQHLKAILLEQYDERVLNENIGYMTGYYGEEVAGRIRDWFEVEHPLSGNIPIGTISERDALTAGYMVAQGVSMETIRKTLEEKYGE